MHYPFLATAAVFPLFLNYEIGHVGVFITKMQFPQFLSTSALLSDSGNNAASAIIISL